MQRLQRPATLHKTRRQILEKLRVRRAFPKLPEITWTPDDTLTKVTRPNAIGHDASGQRMACNRFGEFEPAASFRKRLRFAFTQHGKKPPRHLISQVLLIPPDMDASVGGLIGIPDSV